MVKSSLNASSLWESVYHYNSALLLEDLLSSITFVLLINLRASSVCLNSQFLSLIHFKSFLSHPFYQFSCFVDKSKQYFQHKWCINIDQCPLATIYNNSINTKHFYRGNNTHWRNLVMQHCIHTQTQLHHLMFPFPKILVKHLHCIITW